MWGMFSRLRNFFFFSSFPKVNNLANWQGKAAVLANHGQGLL